MLQSYNKFSVLSGDIRFFYNSTHFKLLTVVAIPLFHVSRSFR